MNTFDVVISKEDCNLIEKLQYEFNAAASIVSFLSEDKQIEWEMIQDEINNAEVKYIEYDLARNIIANKYIPEGLSLERCSWQLDFYENVLTFKEEIKEKDLKNKKIFIVNVDKEDTDELKDLQYRYASSVGVLTFLKENRNANKEIVNEYISITTERKINFEKKKSYIINKYLPEGIDIHLYNWQIDFNTMVSTYIED